MKRTSVWFLSTLLLVNCSFSATADDASKPSEAAPAPKKTETKHPFLGVVVTSVHPTLALNLKDVLSPEQGLTVELVAEESPAAKAGIRVHDVLTAYDDQKLYSAEQLAKLIHSDKTGRTVNIELLRHGKLSKKEVTLGETDSQHPRLWGPRTPEPFSGGRTDRTPPRFRSRLSPHSDWATFDSLTLKKLADDKFRAEIQYLDKEGKKQTHVFEGTREEIRHAIDTQKDLKPAEKAHLLRSLNMHSPLDELLIPESLFNPYSAWRLDQYDDVR